jgi:sulfite exporter TauE/SafE
VPDLLVLGSALLTGLLGSLHCAAMCGGIATGFSVSATRGGAWEALQPNLGRLGGYALAGAVAGGLGHGIVSAAASPALALTLRAAVGALLILMALRLVDRSGRLAFLEAPTRSAFGLLRPLYRHVLPANTPARRVAAGVLWGWLPCGLSASVLAIAWLQVSATHGAMTMLAFGIGGLPVMTSLTWSGARLGQRLQRSRWRQVLAVVVLISGVVTIAAPWLAQVPGVHGVLNAVGCRSIAVS